MLPTTNQRNSAARQLLNTPANLRFVLLVAITLIAAAFRLIPHPPNFAPIGAIALFGGAYFRSRLAAFAVPLCAMAISDMLIGTHANMTFVYGGFALVVLLGAGMRQARQIGNSSFFKSTALVCLSALAASVVFYVVSNFGVWLVGTIYPKTIAGLVTCYIAALPFFQYTVAGDLFYTATMIGTFELLSRQFSLLRPQRSGLPA